jgi:hypothetical protein
MNRTRLPAKLTSLARRDRRRLLLDAAEAALTPEVEAAARDLASEVPGMGRSTALEVLMQVGLKLERRRARLIKSN